MSERLKKIRGKMPKLQIKESGLRLVEPKSPSPSLKDKKFDFSQSYNCTRNSNRSPNNSFYQFIRYKSVAMKKALTPSWFTLTPDQDEKICCWSEDFGRTAFRIARMSVTESSNDDGRTTDSKVSSWVQFKLFKNTPPPMPGPDGHSSQYLGTRKNQQVSLRPIEAERILQRSGQIRQSILSSISTTLPKQLEKMFCDELHPTEEEDAACCHWYLDMFETARRKLRISYIVYNMKDPFGTLYVQIKLFTRSDINKPFLRQSQVNYTLSEFSTLCNYSTKFLTSIQYSVYGADDTQ